MKTKSFITLIIIISANLFAQDMRQNAFSSLFADQKANRVGDAITIIVVEASQASNDAQTSSSRSSDLSLGGNLSSGSSTSSNVDFSLATGNDFTGSGSTKTTGMIKTKISATIDSVLANGNLLIKGSRKISINGEEQIINIKGVVRSSDIKADNSVLSYNISEAEITMEGNGLIDSAQKPGWLTKIFHWLF
jgi:flagellar L-ring protein FlgH